MNKGRRVFMVLGLLGIMVMNSGYFLSYMSAKSSQREIATERIMVSGNKDAINAVAMGVPAEDAIRAVPIQGGVGIGVNLLDWKTLTKNTLRQIAAAAGDMAWMWGVYELTQSGNDNTSKHTTFNISTANSDDTTVTINQNETTTTTTTTTESTTGDGNSR